ncbi:CHAT domain-containing protein [Lentzea fradiae]|uniref:CHAT domain-containing protein n=1 Tax=Lentzea fradiae TaxID=200378 RepID=A0A1G7QZL4_9PSEU|nr:CHAT domain-containing protein [Lentzea fradiae]
MTRLDLRVVDRLPRGARPVVQVKYVDAGDLYLTWRWEHAPDDPRVMVLDRARVGPVLDDLTVALPSPLPSETVPEALDRALRHGAFADRDRENALSAALAAELIPHPLAAELTLLLDRGTRPHLRIQPSPSTAHVPWEALLVDHGTRMVDEVDVSALPPATVRYAPGRRVSAWRPGGPVACVLDPVVPGFPDDSALGSVLGPAPGAITDLVARLGDRLVPAPGVRRADITRDELVAVLGEAARLLYVGHVTTPEHSLDTRLHLSCGATSTGRAGLVRAHRPVTAADIVFGHRAGEPWPMPNRVALIACESGGETRFAEPLGLVAAAIHNGAEYVTATRWTLPTDAGLRRFAVGATETTTALPEAVVAVDHAHDQPDPIAELGAWQRSKAAAWQQHARIEDAPVFWAAFTTTRG